MSRTLVRRVATVLVAGVAATATALAPVAADAAGPYSLLIFPDQGQSAIYGFITSAARTSSCSPASGVGDNACTAR